MAYKVKVIREACISAGSCVVLAPGTFELDEEGIAVIVAQGGEAGNEDSDEDILAGAQSCPVDAIIVEDGEGNQIWPEA